LAGTPGSAQAARGLAKVIRQVSSGSDALFAVDGPLGPARVAKPGAAFIAQRAGAVIVPTSVAARPGVRLAWRWDNHLVPLPGGRIAVHFGPLIDTQASVAGPAPSLDALRATIQEALTAGSAAAARALEVDP
jgi:hypothetical protein